jgi:hypothetical protein
MSFRALVPGGGELYPGSAALPLQRSSSLTSHGHGYSPEQAERLQLIYDRLVEARRELDALIGDAYLRPRASIVPVHFLDLASAVEKLRWAEKEWREIQQAGSEEAPRDGDPRIEVNDLIAIES